MATGGAHARNEHVSRASSEKATYTVPLQFSLCRCNRA